jgi:hypothetical protein
MLTPEEYANISAENYTKVFPEYNPNIHVFGGASVDVVNENSTIMINLYEKSTNDTLPYGVYIVGFSNSHGIYLSPMKVDTMDKYIDLGRDSSSLYTDFKNFTALRPKYEQFKRRHKRGVLLYGKPGIGKTREILRIFENAAELKTRVIFVPSDFDYLSKMHRFREVMEKDSTVIVLEELTERLKGGVEHLLSFLDGEQSWNNSYVIATTNYAQDLPANIIDRPGRFELILSYDDLTEEQIIKFMVGNSVAEEEVRANMAELKALSLDYLGYIAFLHFLNKHPIANILSALQYQRRKISDTFKGKMGIGASRSRNDYMAEALDLMESGID